MVVWEDRGVLKPPKPPTVHATGPKEVQQPAKPSWKEHFQLFIANLKLPWDSISCCNIVYNCL